MRLRRMETVLRYRSGRFVVVLEGVIDLHNVHACLRTAEAMGVQRIFIVRPPPGSLIKFPGMKLKRKQRAQSLQVAHAITKGCERYLSVEEFSSTAECLQRLRAEGYTLWVTDLAPQAVSLDQRHRALLTPLPAKLALAIGNEALGASAEIKGAADQRVYLPMFGFTDSFNLGIATALVLQTLFDWCPEARGDLAESERDRLREGWLDALATTKSNAALIARWRATRVPPLPDLRRDKGGQPRMSKKILRRLGSPELP